MIVSLVGTIDDKVELQPMRYARGDGRVVITIKDKNDNRMATAVVSAEELANAAKFVNERITK